MRHKFRIGDKYYTIDNICVEDIEDYVRCDKRMVGEYEYLGVVI